MKILITRSCEHIGSFLSENIVLYHLSNFINEDSEMIIFWKDKFLNINWKIKNPILLIKYKTNLSQKKFVRKFNGL